MPTFQITGHGGRSGRKRRRTIRAINRRTAIAMAEESDTVVDEVSELPQPPASPELLARAAALPGRLPVPASRTDCVVAILTWCAENHRTAAITYLSDLGGNPWRPEIEPYAFSSSREGTRLRCFLPARDPYPDVVADFQTEGWHLYLVEDIESGEVMPTHFEPRPYRRFREEASLLITVDGLDGKG